MYILENDKLAIHVLPELGGKITSLYLKEKEFELAAPNRTGTVPASRRGCTDREENGFRP